MGPAFDSRLTQPFGSEHEIFLRMRLTAAAARSFLGFSCERGHRCALVGSASATPPLGCWWDAGQERIRPHLSFPVLRQTGGFRDEGGKPMSQGKVSGCAHETDSKQACLGQRPEMASQDPQGRDADGREDAEKWNPHSRAQCLVKLLVWDGRWSAIFWTKGHFFLSCCSSDPIFPFPLPTDSMM